MTSDETNLPVAAIAPSLTQEDRDTLSALLRAGVRENSLRALKSDLDYLEAWSLACDATPLPWPPSRDLILRFIAHHLWNSAIRKEDPEHGMPVEVREILERGGYLRAKGPHAPSTVKRRLSSWRSLCKWREVGDPFDDQVIKKTLAAATRAARRSPRPKSAKPVTADIIFRILESLRPMCSSAPWRDEEMDRIRLIALRDRAMISVAFASGGRRRSEISKLMIGDLEWLDPLQDCPESKPVPSAALRLRQTKTTDDADDPIVYMNGAPVQFLREWIETTGRTQGPVFMSINRWGKLSDTGLGAAGLNDILKKRLAEIGEDPDLYSAHGLRSGYITEAFNQGVPVQDLMGQTLHRSTSTAMSYYNQQNKRKSKAANLLAGSSDQHD